MWVLVAPIYLMFENSTAIFCSRVKEVEFHQVNSLANESVHDIDLWSHKMLKETHLARAEGFFPPTSHVLLVSNAFP